VFKYAYDVKTSRWLGGTSSVPYFLWNRPPIQGGYKDGCDSKSKWMLWIKTPTSHSCSMNPSYYTHWPLVVPTVDENVNTFSITAS